MGEVWRVVLAGSGGQGLGIAGVVLAEAAVIQGLNSAQTQSYGAQARGGMSQATVLITEGEILFPFVEVPNVMLVLNQGGYDRNASRMISEGLLVYDKDYVKAKGRPCEVGLPLISLAQNLGNELISAMLAVGFFNKRLGLVANGSLECALNGHFQGRALELNLEALRKGEELAVSTGGEGSGAIC